MSSRSIRYATTVDGFHIAYEVVGDGPFDLVYVPGWFSNLEFVWEMPDLGDFLRELATFSRLIVFDRRGSGLSDRPFTTDALSLEVGMDDIRAVMDDAGSERAVLFGWEDGGCQSLLYAASYPERTLALILFGIWVKYSESPDYPWGWTPERTEHFWESLANKWGTEEFWRRAHLVFRQQSRPIPSEFRHGLATRASRRAQDRRLRSNAETSKPMFARYCRRSRSRHWSCTGWATQPSDSSKRATSARGSLGPKLSSCLAPNTHPSWAIRSGLNWLRAFVGAIREEEAEFDRVLATVLFTDIVGSTEQAVALGDRAWRDLVEPHHATIRRLLARYRGSEVDTAGDGFFATFDGPARGVRCAHAIVGAVTALGLEVRAGVHTGEVETINNKVGGVAVNIGARIAGIAGPGEVLVSSTVKDLTAGSGLAFEDAGEHELKGIPGPWRIFRVASPAPA